MGRLFLPLSVVSGTVLVVATQAIASSLGAFGIELTVPFWAGTAAATVALRVAALRRARRSAVLLLLAAAELVVLVGYAVDAWVYRQDDLAPLIALMCVLLVVLGTVNLLAVHALAARPRSAGVEQATQDGAPAASSRNGRGS